MAKSVDYVWVDLETTGLDHAHDVPLEIGLLLTDRRLSIIDSSTWIIGDNSLAYLNAVDRAKHDEFVGPMHRASGLFFEWEQAIRHTPEAITRRAVQDSILHWLDDRDVVFGKYAVAGSSVGFDRRMMDDHLPDVNNHFNYRVIDVSSIKETCKRNNPKVFAQMPQTPKVHRPISDIRNSMTEYAYYMENYLWVDWETIDD